MLHLYNTLTRKIEDFTPIDPQNVGYYSCGPTVYDFAHIGHARTYVFADILQRVLEFNGFKVKRVMNITDVGHLTSDADSGEDKMEKGAIREKKSVWEIAEFYTDDFVEMLSKLNIQKPEIVCKATDHITSMIYIIEVSEKKGFTYRIDDGIYFDTSRFPDYGKLEGQTFEKLQKTLKAGARVDMVKGKKNITDFALWKFSASSDGLPRRQMEWWFEGPFAGKLYKEEQWLALDQLTDEGKITKEERNNARLTIGFPGWHIECSAMSMKYLGETLDIHTGGVDHIPIHHTNEIAQSEAATGKKFVKYWLHADHLLVNGEKMSKSLGNFYRVADIEAKGFSPLALRYLFLTANYRTQLNFTFESMKGAQRAYDELHAQISNLKNQISNRERTNLSEEKIIKINQYREKFSEAINDNLNTAKALAVVWEVIKSNVPPSDKYDLILLFDEVLGLDLRSSLPAQVGEFGVRSSEQDIPKEIKDLVKKREELRIGKKWEKADKLRKEIEGKGYILKDTPAGTDIKTN